MVYTMHPDDLSDINVLVGLYSGLEQRFKISKISTRYLEATAGVELFNTDGSHLTPDVNYVLFHLARAEGLLAKTSTP